MAIDRALAITGATLVDQLKPGDIADMVAKVVKAAKPRDSTRKMVTVIAMVV